MPTKVKTGEELRALLDGRKEVIAEGNSVGELLRYLDIRDKMCDDRGKLWRHYSIHVNGGEDIRHLQGLSTSVKDGDTVMILCAISGG